MARPVLHALFHSVAALGYIPFALTSVLISSSSPYVSIMIPSVGVILIAFLPPLTCFPTLCFSYRYLEKVEWISLTVQRARTYLMLAGSGICILVAAHLMMVQLVNNEHNSGYGSNRVPVVHDLNWGSFQALEPIVTSPDPVATGTGAIEATTTNMVMPPIMVIDTAVDPLKTDSLSSSILSSLLINGAVQEPELHPLKDKEYQDQDQDQDQGEGVTLVLLPPNQKRNDRMASSPVPYKSHIPMHLLRPPKEPVALEEGRSDLTLEPTGPGVRPASEVLMEERDILTGQQAFMASDQPAVQSIQSIDGIPTIEVPSRQTWPGSQPEPVSSLPEPQTISNPDLADQDLPHAPLTIIYTPIPNPESSPQQQDHITDPTEAKNPEGILQDQTFFHGPPTPPPPTGSESESGSSSIGHESESPPTSSSPSSSYTEWYYSLTGLHWMIYIGSQCFLTVLLVMMFLGVLITIEHVLDIEDEDLINLKYHYWARVVGIVSATITSAIHGSILSGYVLLDGHSDWIAKAAVGAICIYWIGITWLMNRVAGPLPY